MRSHVAFAAGALALGLAVATAEAGGQQIAVEVAPGGQSLLVRTYRCGNPADIRLTGTAEGVVAGQPRTVTLRLARTSEPGVFSVARQWPAEGTWVLRFANEHGPFVNALVELEAGAALRIVSQESTLKKHTLDEVQAALRRRTRS